MDFSTIEDGRVTFQMTQDPDRTEELRTIKSPDPSLRAWVDNYYKNVQLSFKF